MTKELCLVLSRMSTPFSTWNRTNVLRSEARSSKITLITHPEQKLVLWLPFSKSEPSVLPLSSAESEILLEDERQFFMVLAYFSSGVPFRVLQLACP